MNFDELRRDIEEHIEHETRDNIMCSKGRQAHPLTAFVFSEPV